MRETIIKDYCRISVLFFSLKKVSRLMEEKQYAIQIKEALDFIKESKDAVRSVEEKKIKELTNFRKNQLKSKGKSVLNPKM